MAKMTTTEKILYIKKLHEMARLLSVVATQYAIHPSWRIVASFSLELMRIAIDLSKETKKLEIDEIEFQPGGITSPNKPEGGEWILPKSAQKVHQNELNAIREVKKNPSNCKEVDREKSLSIIKNTLLRIYNGNLKGCLANEDFERAAILRDRIKELEK